MCLKDFCDEAIKKFPPEIDPKTGAVLKTFCNFAVDYVAQRMGYKGFNYNGAPYMADRICSVLLADWLELDGEQAHRLAASGVLCIAAQSSAEIRAAAIRLNKPALKDARHGHIAVVYPAPRMVQSASWRKEVPLLANVGRKNGILGASQCFPAEPKYFYKPGGHPSTLGGNQ